MPSLTLHQNYDRQDVHALFAPTTRFTPQAGTWGLHGIVTIPDRPGDFVFFVTFGQEQGDHVFDEGITPDGVLSWQSQPRQDLQSEQIQQFINHDELTNSIYLFLRTRRGRPYTYLGRLKYLSHDADREKPVYFQWQLLDWPIPPGILASMDMKLYGRSSASTSHGTQTPRIVAEERAPYGPTNTLILNDVPPAQARRGEGVPTPLFRGRKQPDYAAVDARNRDLGRAGELLVVQYEQERLRQEGASHLCEQIVYIAEVQGDGDGYDIQSYDADGSVRYIEVKTTRGPANTPFFMSSNERAFAQQHSQNYFIYRVYEYHESSNTGQLYIVAGEPEAAFELTPTNYRVRLR